MPAMIFDIETGPLPEDVLLATMPPFDPAEVKTGNLKDPEKIAAKFAEAEASHKATCIDRAALDPTTGRVLAIGYRVADRIRIDIQDTKWGEVKLLLRFWETYREAAKKRQRMVGFNIHGFDLPFLIRRSWGFGIPVPEDVMQRDRYWNDLFVDLMQRWKLGNYQTHASLNRVAKFFSVGGKPEDGTTGADFARLWKEDPEKAASYLKNDLDMTYHVALRMGIV